MNDLQEAPTAQDALAESDRLMAEYLSQNPELAAALATFDVAQAEYRRSLLAMTNVRLVTASTTNVEE